MKRKLSTFFVFTLLLVLLSGCGKEKVSENAQVDEAVEQVQTTTEEEAEGEFPTTDADMFTKRDLETEYDTKNAVTIQLNGTTATASSNSVQIHGSTITITEEATYVISGSLEDGMLVVNASDSAKLQLVFDGVDITSETSAALYVLEADKVFVTLADGSTNTLANGGNFTAIDENNIDAVVFSKQDLTFNGSGSLTITSPVGHGVVCKDDLVITGGTFTVQAASHGLDANDSVRLTDAELYIDAGKDMIHCENSDDPSLGFVYISSGTITGEAEGDGISAGSYLQIEDGTFELLAGGGSENGSKASSGNYGGFMGGGHGRRQENNTVTTEDTVSMKGLKAENDIWISGGNFTINSADDSIHSNASIMICGGNFQIASGDDGVHADDTLRITACEMNITESYEGLEAQHLDIQGGEIQLVATDDGLNAAGGTDSSGTMGGRDGMFGDGHQGMMGSSSSSNGSIVISGGNLYINASGDGIDANGTLEISGGYTVVVGPTQGDTATLDYDKTGIITGGTFIGTGALNMAQSFSDSEQGVIAVNVGNQSAGSQIVLKDQNGNTLMEHEPELSYAVVILSSPEIVSGEMYSITVGSQSGEVEAK